MGVLSTALLFGIDMMLHAVAPHHMLGMITHVITMHSSMLFVKQTQLLEKGLADDY